MSITMEAHMTRASYGKEEKKRINCSKELLNNSRNLWQHGLLSVVATKNRKAKSINDTSSITNTG